MRVEEARESKYGQVSRGDYTHSSHEHMGREREREEEVE